ncbi:hypothetical protein AQJ91_27765 [Streptomyces dysideae]|uniref:Uncharacterized protein n=1 Tax=Streptomyces dysideae TaxID=909626 RepID=A0A101UW42_9ACTN|nr:hypothetical protein AQJ91_27765 [Streptomyces dysideae]
MVSARDYRDVTGRVVGVRHRPVLGGQTPYGHRLLGRSGLAFSSRIEGSRSTSVSRAATGSLCGLDLGQPGRNAEAVPGSRWSHMVRAHVAGM